MIHRNSSTHTKTNRRRILAAAFGIAISQATNAQATAAAIFSSGFETPPPSVQSKAAAARFLTQATFGPTQATIDGLFASGNLARWIDDQMRMPTSTTLPYVMANSNGSHRSFRHYIWWQNVMRGDDQLRQRVAFALSEIFVISDLDYILGNSQYGVSSYYDMLAEHAFGNYRELLEDVTLHPTMGIYLGMVRNRKAEPELNIRPDENFAREVLQLFSIGLNQLNQRGEVLSPLDPIPTYDQSTVENFARVFTGWNYAGADGDWLFDRGYDRTINMVADYNPALPDSYHDTEPKTLLDSVMVMNDPQSATPTEDDLAAALDNIYFHPNVGPFFSKLLIQRLTTSNPSPEYVERIASRFNDNGRGERGDLAAVVTAILLDDEARFGTLVNPNFGKVKEPILRLTQFWRALNAEAGVLSSYDEYRTGSKSALTVDEVLGQAIMKSPSVFNFFQPDNPLNNDPQSQLVAPELQIVTEENVAALNNELRSLVYTFNNQSDGGYQAVTRINIDRAVQLAPDSTALIDYLDLLLLAGAMPVPMRTTLEHHIATLPATTDGLRTRALDSIFMIVASPTFMVQQ